MAPLSIFHKKNLILGDVGVLWELSDKKMTASSHPRFSQTYHLQLLLIQALFKTFVSAPTAQQMVVPGLNRLGYSAARIDYAINGQNPPHTHSRASEVLLVNQGASEVLLVNQGTLFVGFITSNPDNRLFTKTLNVGDLFLFPQGLIHFQVNIGRYPAVVFVGLSSQNPGTITIANSVFGSNPQINPNILSRAFQLDARIIMDLQTKFRQNL